MGDPHGLERQARAQHIGLWQEPDPMHLGIVGSRKRQSSNAAKKSLVFLTPIRPERSLGFSYL
jgi:hypothetical protein